jgi:predicted protein tyrosine phosphatase
MTLIICALSQIHQVIKSRRPSHMVTLLSPAEMIDTPKGLSADRHLRIKVNDIAQTMPGLVAPDEAMVTRIVTFGAGWTADAPMLVHCWAGISRSTATAFILACERNPDVNETRIAEALRAASRYATPNRRFVALADDLLGRKGRMVDAVTAIGQGEVTMESHTFDLPVRYAAD